MRNIVVYYDGVNHFSAFTYEKVFEWFRQTNEYERFLEGIIDEIFNIDTSPDNGTDLLIYDIWKEVKNLMIVYDYFQKKNDDVNMEIVSKEIIDIIEHVVINSKNSVTYFKEYCEKELTEIPLYE